MKSRIARSVDFVLRRDVRHKSVTSLSNAIPTAPPSISTLANGVRLVSEDVPGHFAAVGVYVDAGTRYERQGYFGLSHFLEKLAFRSTQKSSMEEVMNTLERIGGNILCSSSKEHIMYQASVFKHDIVDTLNLMADTVCIPTLSLPEMEEARHAIHYELGETYAKPEWLIPELAHRAAFLDNTYGIPAICSPDSLDAVSVDQLRLYRDLFYRPANIVVAAVGMDHERLSELVSSSSLSDLKDSALPEPVRDSVKYTGGHQMHEVDSEKLTKLFLGFESCSFAHEDIYAISTLQMMLGGGDSFSAGGPGKGMYSRLYTNVLNRYYWVESITCTNSCYKDSGLFGFQATVPHNGVANILTVIGTEIRKIMEKPISKVELERAKNQLRSSLFMNLEAKMVHLEDLGRQVQMQGFRHTPKEMGERIEQVTSDDVKRVLGKMIASNPTFMVHGSAKFVPDFDRIQRAFGLGKYAAKV